VQVIASRRSLKRFARCIFSDDLESVQGFALIRAPCFGASVLTIDFAIEPLPGLRATLCFALVNSGLVVAKA
jgi:hypothetical protein